MANTKPVDCNILDVRLKFRIPKSLSQTFVKELVAKMHKYLTKNAITVYAVDTKIYGEK